MSDFSFPHSSREFIKMVLLQKDLIIMDILLAWPQKISPKLETLLNKTFALNFVKAVRREQ